MSYLKKEAVEIEIFVGESEGDDGKLVPAMIRKDCLHAFWPSIYNPNRTYVILGGTPIQANITYEALKKLIDNDFERFLDHVFEEPMFAVSSKETGGE